MKATKKIILLILCAILLGSSAAAVTMAFLTDTDADTNTFVMGNVKISLDEAKVTPDGIPVTENGKEIRTSESNLYRLVPGGRYTKDPTVTIKGGGSDSYVRMTVTVSGYGSIKTAFGDSFAPKDFVEGLDENVWIYSGKNENSEKDSVTYEFRYYKIAEGSAADVKLEPLFTTFVMPEYVTSEDIEIFAENIRISVAAHGVQAAGFDTEEEAWNAFDIQTSG